MILAFILQNYKYFIRSGIIYHIFFYNLLITMILLFVLKIDNVFNICWIIIFLSTFLSLDLLFKQEIVDGKLDLLYLSNFPLYFYSLFKYILYWICCHLPFLLFVSLLASFSLEEITCLMLGSFSCTLLGGLNYMFTFGLLEKVLILSIMVFPLFIPILIFGTSLQIGLLFKLTFFFLITIPYFTAWFINKNIL